MKKKKKGKKKELAGKKPTKFNSTKFVELQNNLRSHQATLVEYENEKELEDEAPLEHEEYEKENELVEDEPEVNDLTCNICKKILASEKGLKIHMTKTHVNTDSVVSSSSFSCNLCDKVSVSERGLKIHKSKAHC